MKLGLVGHPVGHSRSPALHRAALHAAGLRGTYELFDHPPGTPVTDTFERLRDAGFSGFNVTVPFKLDALRWVSALSPAAERAGAVNTVVLGAGGSVGHNTDVDAVVESAAALCSSDGAPCGAPPAPRAVVCLGTGGAARAVVAGFAALGVPVVVRGRDASAAARLQSELGAATGSRDLAPELVINATTLGNGGSAVTAGAFDALAGELVGVRFALDLVYAAPPAPEQAHRGVTRAETAFVTWARHQGLVARDGLHMLVCQAAHAFELWTGVPRKASVIAMGAECGLTELAAGRRLE